MRVTVQIEDIVGRGASTAGRPWLWPVFFALDDTALASILAGRAAEDGVLRPHPPVTTSSSRRAVRAAARQAPPVATHSFDLQTDLVRTDRALVGFAALLERGDGPSEEARDAVDELVMGLQLTLSRRLGESLGLGSLLSAFGGGGADLFGGGGGRDSGLSLKDLKRGSTSPPDSGALDRLARGPVLPMLREQIPDADRERALGFSVLSGLVADPDYDVGKAYHRPPLVAGHRPGELASTPDREDEATAPEDASPRPGPRLNDLSAAIRRGAIRPGVIQPGIVRPDVPGRTGRIPPGLLRDHLLGRRPPLGVNLPTAPERPTLRPDLPRRFRGLELDRPLTLPDLSPESGGVVASGFTFWRFPTLDSGEARTFSTRLHGERGARVSYVVRGTVRIAPRGQGRPTGWSRSKRAGSHLAVPTEEGSLSVYLRGSGAAARASIRLKPDAVPAGRISGGTIADQHLIVWRDATGRIHSGEKEGGESWKLRAISRKDGAIGDPTLLANAGGKRWALAHGVDGGGIRIHVGDGRRWKQQDIHGKGPEVEQVGLGSLPGGKGLWAAWAGEDGMPMTAFEGRPGSWKVSRVPGTGKLPRIVRSPLALTDGTGRLPGLAYLASDGPILLVPSRGRWRVERPELRTLPPAVGDLSGVSIPGWKSVALGFRSADGGIHLLLREGQGTWRHEALGRIPATPGGGSDPCMWLDGRRLHMSWLDEQGRVWEASRAEDGTWRSADLDALTDASGPVEAKP